MRAPNFVDHTGRRFGLLTAVRYENRKWLCRCDCGNETWVFAGNLNKGNTRSCGCLRGIFNRAVRTTHGSSKKPEYRVWADVKGRCSNPGHSGYYKYGAKGIRMCEAWAASFEAFYADMGPRTSPLHSIERKDVRGDYEPNNCVWATAAEQAMNKTNSHRITAHGETLVIAEWARRLGCHAGTVQTRLKLGWAPVDAVTRPVKRREKSA
jgi:hypothetical protein